jgi:8-amino-7-oxononanoate synthase
VAAFKAGADRYGVGAGASHLVSGHTQAHHALEEELADFIGAPRALLFSTGYMANEGVIAALMDRHGTVLEDKLNHASLIDAARLSTATVKRYAHVDTARLEALLAAARGEQLIATDGVFSMDGDIAPLPALLAAAERHGAWLLVDEAHALGVLGEHGRGSLEHFGVQASPTTIIMGTLGKALGTFGAFVTGESALIETLIQEARTYIYTTALPPAVAEATRASLALVRTEPWRRARLRESIGRFREAAGGLGFTLLPSTTPIQGIVLHEPERALAASQFLREQGILIPAIRPPTVAAHTARLRITFSAVHEPDHLDRLIDALTRLAQGLRA